MNQPIPNMSDENKLELSDEQILQKARQMLDRGLCFSRTAHITRATDDELIAFARALLDAQAATVQALPPLLEGWREPAEWLRNNYQDHANIADLCEAMIAAPTQPSTEAPVAQPAPMPNQDKQELHAALQKAFMTLQSSGGEDRSIILKFNRKENAYVVHDFLLHCAVKDDPSHGALPVPAQQVADQQDAELLDWLVNNVLYCDYGDNDAPGHRIGWGVRLDKQDGKQFIFGGTPREAIETAIKSTKERGQQWLK